MGCDPKSRREVCSVDVIVTSECIHLYVLCIIPRCLFWDVVPRPEGKSFVISKWICKIKHAADGSIEKYKVRFVACGFSQKEGIYYEELLHLKQDTLPLYHYLLWLQ